MAEPAYPLCSMPLPEYGTSPAMAAVEKDQWEWAERFNLLPTKAVRDHMRRTRPHYCTSLYFPHADFERLVAPNRYMLWAFRVDDILDDAIVHQDEAAVAEFTGELIAVSLGTRSPQREIARAMADVLDDLGVGRSPAWRRLLAEENVRWLERYVIEIKASRAGRVMPLHEYLTHRRYSVGELNFLYFEEYVRGIDLPTPVRFLPAMRHARNLAAEWVGIYNDVRSSEKEKALGYPHNAVLMAQKWLHCSADRATDAVNTLADGLLKQFEAALGAVPGQLCMLPENTPQVTQDVRNVVEGYRHLVRGNWDYPLTTPRYVETDDYIPSAHATSRRPDWITAGGL
ncbi:terpene synthase family protein [Streptomyces buecherae]|uniref:Terpene synthase n=1 Tax=Streptomyces buecherae TaxID=2763006 RepID=A0A7H8NGJ2_9ACTN|nr:hypothetical protein [Streptomyces buecherae]QKW53627.1 hypothetical protein HUT08_33355 [Streptomyces buecherae]